MFSVKFEKKFIHDQSFHDDIKYFYTLTNYQFESTKYQMITKFSFVYLQHFNQQRSIIQN
ncbi:hypothetical protein pb186bvf_017277 [Paramecium bursaria]